MSNNSLRVCNPTYPNVPILMHDGRLFTDYRSAKCGVLSQENISNVDEYRNTLTRNADIIMNQNLNQAQTITSIYGCEGNYGENLTNPNNCTSNISQNIVENYQNIQKNLNKSCKL